MNKARFPGGRSGNRHPRAVVSYRDVRDSASNIGKIAALHSSCFTNGSGNGGRNGGRADREKVMGGGAMEIGDKFYGFTKDDPVRKALTAKREQLSTIVGGLEMTTKSWESKTVAGAAPPASTTATRQSTRVKKVPRRKFGIDLKPGQEVKPVPDREEKDKIMQADCESRMSGESVPISDAFTTPTKPDNPSIFKGVKTKVESVSHDPNTLQVKKEIFDLTEEFVKGKDEFAASFIALVDGKHNVDYKSWVPQEGMIRCGVCSCVVKTDNPSVLRKYGSFLCSTCIDTLNKAMRTAKKAASYVCLADGKCDIIPGSTICEACFVRDCLLLLDLTDDIYFKMWTSVPPKAKNWVPPTPPKVKRFLNRGKTVFVDQFNGSVLSVQPFKHKARNSENDNGQTNRNPQTKGVKRLYPNDELSKIKLSGVRMKQVTRKAIERFPRATFGDIVELNEEMMQHAQSKMLLGRIEEDAIIKVVPLMNSTDFEWDGYPIIVAKGEEPPKPLCFVCGSAGIKQVIFCSICCEPFHPYCAEDDLLLSAFMADSLSSSDHKSVVVASRTDTISRTMRNGIELETQLQKRFRIWKCHRCTKCKLCNKLLMTYRNELVDSRHRKCYSCLDSYHIACLKNFPNGFLKTNEKSQWMCHNCLKCSSCGIYLTKSLSSSSVIKRNFDDESSFKSEELLCVECLKRRQKGCFCPVCLACYDNNDWDSKMIECDKCGKWIHAKCEGLSDEGYSILGTLPECIVYTCRLCAPPLYEVGWRQAIESEFVDGCYKILEIFHKKLQQVFRKRVVLNLEEFVTDEERQGQVSVEKDTSFEKVMSSLEVTGDELLLYNETTLCKKYNIKRCFIKMIDMDVTKSPTEENLLRSHAQLQKSSTPTMELPQLQQQVPETPTKVHEVADVQTPKKHSMDSSAIDSFFHTARSTVPACVSLAEFSLHCTKLIQDRFHEFPQNCCLTDAKLVEYFLESISKVFLWFEVSNGDLGPRELCRVEDVEVKRPESCELVIVAPPPPSEVVEEVMHESNSFEEVFWDENDYLDYRYCLFCGERGDLPASVSGRLLYAGPPGDWVHVNCAIWSSEVWEEADGALQQVEIALNRSKKTSCEHCEEFGASLNCCATNCRHCYHFMCAVNAECSLMDDKTVFCPQHTKFAKGKPQKDMHVLRTVHVDLELSRKKSLRLDSKDLQVLIGSMRIDNLGRILPISVSNLDGEMGASSFVIPVGYECDRLFWSSLTPRKPVVCCLATSLRREGDFRLRSQILNDQMLFSVVIDHARSKDEVKGRFELIRDFFEHVETAPRFIDEYRTEYIPPYIPTVTASGKCRKRLSQGRSRKDSFNELEVDSAIECVAVVNRATIEWEVKTLLENASKPGRVSQPCWSYLSECPLSFEASSTHQASPLEPSFRKPSPEFIQQTGLLHPGVQFLIEQLSGAVDVAGKYTFRFNHPTINPEDSPVTTNSTGCARTEGYCGRRPFDMFGWLASKHRKVPVGISLVEETVKSKGLPIAMRFRNLREKASKDLVVLSSHIHGRGLFAKRDIEMGEMLIEYAGEVIRSPVCDERERKYEQNGMGCYMFRINRDFVIDATMKGNAARFINHSCEPNCESKSVKILGKGHILILALKNIGRGEELTYDYKFEREADKLPCSCSSKKCRKFLN